MSEKSVLRTVSVGLRFPFSTSIDDKVGVLYYLITVRYIVVI